MLGRYILYNTSIFYRHSIEMPFSLHLKTKDVVLLKGEEFHLSVFGINKRVSYYSTNFLVAGVNFTGRVYAYRTGKAFIIAKVDGKKLKCRVRVIGINRKSIVLMTGRSFRLRIYGGGCFIRWRTGNVKVASVTRFGRVKAVSKGTTVITARVKGKIVQCRVRVI